MTKRKDANAPAVAAVRKLTERMIATARRAIVKRDGLADDCEISSWTYRRLCESAGQLLRAVAEGDAVRDRSRRDGVPATLPEPRMDAGDRNRVTSAEWGVGWCQGRKAKGSEQAQAIKAAVLEKLNVNPRMSVTAAGMFVADHAMDKNGKPKPGWSWGNIKLAIRGMKKPKK